MVNIMICLSQARMMLIYQLVSLKVYGWMRYKNWHFQTASIYAKIKDEYIRDVFRTLLNISDGYFLLNTTMQKVSVFGVILTCILSEFGEILTRITPNTDTFWQCTFLKRVIDNWKTEMLLNVLGYNQSIMSVIWKITKVSL